MRANANLNTAGEEQADFNQPLTQTASFNEAVADEDDGLALLGARHDLTLSETGKQQAACSCLAVKVGMPSDPAFQWRSVVPQIDAANQVIVALSSEGQSCEQPKDSLGASYWGYQKSGNDVIIVVENARFGRPLTAGAVIPRPVGDGHVYVRPLDRKVPFAKVDGQNLCRVM